MGACICLRCKKGRTFLKCACHPCRKGVTACACSRVWHQREPMCAECQASGCTPKACRCRASLEVSPPALASLPAAR